MVRSIKKQQSKLRVCSEKKLKSRSRKSSKRVSTLNNVSSRKKNDLGEDGNPQILLYKNADGQTITEAMKDILEPQGGSGKKKLSKREKLSQRNRKP